LRRSTNRSTCCNCARKFSVVYLLTIAAPARHPRRPSTLDYIWQEISDEWMELHGDRRGSDDPAIAGGVARLAGRPVAICLAPRRDTKDNIARNFAWRVLGITRQCG